MSRPTNPKIDPPEHLVGDALSYWTSVQADFGITDAPGLRLLRLAAECLATAEIARLAIAHGGLTFIDRFGAPRPRPEARLANAAMMTFRALVRELRLDPPEAGV